MRISVDDGCASDVRLAGLCEQYHIELILYWPVDWHSLAEAKGYEPITFSRAYKLAQHFEIGAHTITHRLLTEIKFTEALYEMGVCQSMLSLLFEQQPRKFAPPRGYISADLLKAANRYYDEVRLTKAPNLVHIHPNSGANDNQPWREAFNKKVKQGIKDIECWGHSHEFDRFNMWTEIEEFLSEQTSSSH